MKITLPPVTPSQAYFSVPYKTRGWITGNIACAPDGRYLAAASRLGIWLYDTETDEEVRLFTGHQDTVTDVAFSPDGNTLVSAVEAGTIRLWDVNTGEQKHIFTPATGSRARIAFSPAGNALAVTLSNRTLYLWNVDTGEHNSITAGDAETQVVFSSDGRVVAFDTSSSETIRLCDTETGAEKHTFNIERYDGESIVDFTFSPDGQTLGIADSHGNISFYDTETGAEKHTFNIELSGSGDKSIADFTFSPDGQTLGIFDSHGNIRLSDAKTGVEKQEISDEFLGDIIDDRYIFFILDGRTRVLMIGRNDTIFLWDFRNIMAESEDTTPQIIRLPWGSHKCKVTQRFRGHTGAVGSVAFNYPGKTCASSSSDDTVRLWDAKTAEETNIFRCTGHRGITKVAFGFLPIKRSTIEGSTRTITTTPILAGGCSDGSVRLWDVDAGVEMSPLEGHRRAVTSIALTRYDDKYILASGSHDKTVQLWNLETGERLHRLKGHRRAVNSIAISPWEVITGLGMPRLILLASGSHDKTVQLWNLETGERLHRLKGHRWAVNSIAISPVRELRSWKYPFASADIGGEIYLWEVERGAVRHTLKNQGAVCSIAFSPDGQMLASAGFGGTIQLWEVETGTLKQTLTTHTEIVWSVAFSRDGQMLASAHDNGEVLLWT